MSQVLWAWLALCCILHNVPIEQAVAVAHIESRLHQQAFRVGRLGHSPYGGPFGIRNCFPGWDDPWQNIELGVKAIARLSRRHGFWKGLHRYNEAWTPGYAGEIKKTIRRIKAYEVSGFRQTSEQYLCRVSRSLESKGQ